MSKILSKSFVEKQKKVLEKLKSELLNQISVLKAEDPFADPDHASDNAAVDTDVREQVGHETVEAEIKDIQKRLSDIQHATSRIQKGRYGVCEKCNELIPVARLTLVPEARYCMDCERKLKK